MFKVIRSLARPSKLINLARFSSLEVRTCTKIGSPRCYLLAPINSLESMPNYRGYAKKSKGMVQLFNKKLVLVLIGRGLGWVYLR